MKKNLAFLLVVIFVLTAVLGVAPMATAEEAEIVTPSTEIAYFNISLRVGATLLFAVPSEGYTVNPDGTVDNLKLLVVKDASYKGIGGVTEGEFIEASGKYMIAGKEHIIFEYSGLAANEMCDIVYARTVFVDENGFYNYGDVKGYSVTEFLQQYETDDARINKLIGSMLRYGDAAIDYQANEGVKANYLPSESDSELYTIKIKRVVDGVAIDEEFELNQFAKAGETTLSAPPVYGASVTSWEGAEVVDGKVTVSGNLELTAYYTTDKAVKYYSIDQSAATVDAHKGMDGSSGTMTGAFVVGTAFGAANAHAYSYCNFTVVEDDGVKVLKFAHNGAGQHNFGLSKVGENGVFTGKGLSDSQDYSIEIKVKANEKGTFPRTSLRIDRTGDLNGKVDNKGGAGEILSLMENGDIVLKGLNGADVVLGKGDATKYQTITVVCDASEHKFIGYIDGVKCGETTMNVNAPYLYASLGAGVNNRYQICMYGGYQASYWNAAGYPADIVGEGKLFNFTEKEGGAYVIDKDTGLYRALDVWSLEDAETYKDATKYAISYTAGETLESAIAEYVKANEYFYFAGATVYIGNVMAD